MELAASSSARQSGGLISAAISAVLTIRYVAKSLGDHEDWLHERQIDMFPEDGCLHVNGVGDEEVSDGIVGCRGLKTKGARSLWPRARYQYAAPTH